MRGEASGAERLFNVEEGGGRESGRSGLVLVTERDVRVLRWIGEQYAVRLDTVAELLGQPGRPLHEGRARQVVGRWRAAGLAVSRKFIAGQRSFVWPTREGLALALPGYRPKAPAVSMLAHLHAVARVRLAVEARYPQPGWVCERALYRERGSSRSHVPDGVFTDPSGARVAVEVELTPKGPDRLDGILDRLALDFDAVLYVVGHPAVRSAVERAAERGRLTDRLRITDLTALTTDNDKEKHHR